MMFSLHALAKGSESFMQQFVWNEMNVRYFELHRQDLYNRLCKHNIAYDTNINAMASRIDSVFPQLEMIQWPE